MIQGSDLFFSLFNNLAIFIALVTLYGYFLGRLRQTDQSVRQILYGLSFGLFAIGCMYARIPVFEGVVVDQRNAVITLSGAFCGPLSALLSAGVAALYRIYLGGNGVTAGVIGLGLSAAAGTLLYGLADPFDSARKASASAIGATLIILPGFLFIGDLQAGWHLMKVMSVPYGTAVFIGIFLTGLLLNREEERHQANLLFRKSEEQYRRLIQGTGDLITQVNREGVFTFVNPVSEQVLGVPPQECIGMSAFEFIHPDDKEQIEEWFKTCIARKLHQGKIETRQVNIRTGHASVISWLSTFHFDDLGRLTGTDSIGRDITKIRAAEENYRSLFERMPEGYLVLDTLAGQEEETRDYRVVGVNPAFERLTGIPGESLINKVVSREFSTQGKSWNHLFEKLDLSGDTDSFEHFSKEIGRHFHVTVYKTGENQFALIFQDITFQKKAEEEKRQFEEQLRRTQKMEAIGTLAGGIAHDFNNILAAILGYTEIIKSELPETTPVGKELDKIIEAGLRAKSLVRQILAFSSKIEQKRFPVNIQPVAEEALSFLRATIPSTVRIESRIDPRSGDILADPTQIHQVLMNLCTNAAHAMEDSGGTLTVTIETFMQTEDLLEGASPRKTGPYVRLSVEDTGPGIEPGLLDKIFDPYFTTKTFGKGTGMGLAVVHGIVKSHNGHITVKSSPGKGTCFDLFFPEIQTTGNQEINPQPVFLPDPLQTPPFFKAHILVVDDDQDIAHLTQKQLKHLGYNSTACVGSLKALDLFRSDPGAFDLVITDQTMPEMTGEELSRKMLEIRPDLPIVMCTGYSTKMDAQKAQDIGIKDFLMKPAAKTELALTVRKALGRGENDDR